MARSWKMSSPSSSESTSWMWGEEVDATRCWNTLSIDGPSGPVNIQMDLGKGGGGGPPGGTRERHIGHSESGTPIPLQNFIFNKFFESHLITLLYTRFRQESERIGKLRGLRRELCGGSCRTAIMWPRAQNARRELTIFPGLIFGSYVATRRTASLLALVVNVAKMLGIITYGPPWP